MTEFLSRPYDCSVCHKVTHVTLVRGGAWLCYDCRKEYVLDNNERTETEIT